MCYRLNVDLSENDEKLLTKLCMVYDVGISELVRNLIRTEFIKNCDGEFNKEWYVVVYPED